MGQAEFTVTEKVQVAVAPLLAVAVIVIVCVPTAKFVPMAGLCVTEIGVQVPEVVVKAVKSAKVYGAVAV